MQGHFRHTPTVRNCRSFGCVLFIERDLFDNSVPFDNTIPIYLINLPWILGLGLVLDLQLHYFSIFHGEYRKRTPYLPRISRKINTLLNERTQMINNKIKLHILGVPINKLGN